MFGSHEISESYSKSNVRVVSYLNMDQSGYVKKGTNPVIGIDIGFTSLASNALLRNVITGYSTLQWANMSCGEDCSDNASWFFRGYEVAFPFESLIDNGTYMINFTNQLKNQNSQPWN